MPAILRTNPPQQQHSPVLSRCEIETLLGDDCRLLAYLRVLYPRGRAFQFDIDAVSRALDWTTKRTTMTGQRLVVAGCIDEIEPRRYAGSRSERSFAIYSLRGHAATTADENAEPERPPRRSRAADAIETVRMLAAAMTMAGGGEVVTEALRLLGDDVDPASGKVTPRQRLVEMRRERDAEALAQLVELERIHGPRNAVAILARRLAMDPTDAVEHASKEKWLRRLRARDRPHAPRPLSRLFRTNVRLVSGKSE